MLNHYEFGDCRVDVGCREFYRAGAGVRLRPKVFDLLIVLIERRDRVVSRDQLLELLWPGRYVSDTTLSSCIKELRRAVGDTGRSQSVIKTSHSRGFRFVASLRAPGAQPVPLYEGDRYGAQARAAAPYRAGAWAGAQAAGGFSIG